MNSKKQVVKIMVAVIMVTVSSLSFGQGFYISVGGGYSGDLAKGEIYNFLTESPNVSVGPNAIVANDGSMFNYTNFTNKTTTEVLRSSLGAGGNIHLRAGYNFNENIGVEAEGQYLWGTATKSTLFDSLQPIIGPTTIDTEMRVRIWSFTPSVVINGGLSNKWNPYIKAGLHIAVPEATTNMKSQYAPFNIDFVDEIISKTRKGVAVGFKGVLGVQYAASERIAVFGELSVIGMSWRPQQEEVTSYTQTTLADQKTTDILAQQFPNPVFEYEKTVTNDNNAQNIVQQPSIPLSSIGGNIGIVFKFPGSASKSRLR